MRRSSGDGGLVYSTEQGRMCPDCGRAKEQCVCGQKARPAHGDGIVRVGRETKGRKGAGVTVITGIAMAPAELAALCTQLKKKCGSGGAVKDGVIEIQGEHRQAIADELTRQGWKVKIAGG